MSYNRENGFFANVPKVTGNLMAISVLVFIACQINRNLMLENFALFFPASRFFKLWQPVTYMFMHVDLLHILFNMYSLFLFGSVVERNMGTRKFLSFYLVCGLGAALVHLGVQLVEFLAYSGAGNFSSAQQLNYIPTLGASGAVYGVMMAFAMLYPNIRMTLLFPPVTMKARTMVLVFAGLDLLNGLTAVDGVAHFAHLGGLLTGWLLVRWWLKRGDLYKRF